MISLPLIQIQLQYFFALNLFGKIITITVLKINMLYQIWFYMRKVCVFRIFVVVTFDQKSIVNREGKKAVYSIAFSVIESENKSLFGSEANELHLV